MVYPRSPESRSGRRLRNYLVERAEKDHQQAMEKFLTLKPDGADRECSGYRRDCILPAREVVRGYAPDRVLVYEAELCDRCTIFASFDLDVFQVEYDDLPEKSGEDERGDR